MSSVNSFCIKQEIDPNEIYISQMDYQSMDPRTDDTFLTRMERIVKSQTEYEKLFVNLNTIIDQLKEKYPPLPDDIESITTTIRAPSSSASTTTSELYTSGRSSANALEMADGYVRCNKRRLSESSDFIDIDGYDTTQSEYPKRINTSPAPIVIIGPNGTQISAKAFDEIVWSSSAAATRSLLAHVFSSDILATHTLTGKPSPAFYGRERPPKMQLDPLKTSDIIHCVRSKCGGNEREIRAAITTKCADTAKKYKRRLIKRTKIE